MARTITVVFDGEVFRPSEPLDLPANSEYQLTIEDPTARRDGDATTEVFRRILDRARDLGVGDLAEQHDHYLYGTPKR